MKYPFISFFSGALGLDLGLEQAGLTVIMANENDRDAIATIRHNRPRLPLYTQDILELSANDILSDTGLQAGDLFLVAGGPPCQSFSTVGKRRGLTGNNAFLHFLRLIGELKPAYVVIENVRGLLSMPLPSSGKRSGVIRLVASHLAESGYAVSFNLYNTAMFGVPQSRERVVIFGALRGLEVPDLIPTHEKDGGHGLKPWVTFRSATADLKGRSQEHSKFSPARLKYLSMLKPGEHWRSLPAHLQEEAMGKAFFSTGGRTTYYRRLFGIDRRQP